MLTNLGFGLLCLTVPLCIELLNLQSNLTFSGFIHTVVEVFILLGTYLLITQIIRLDQWIYLHYSIHQREAEGRKLTMKTVEFAPIETPLPPAEKNDEKDQEKFLIQDQRQPSRTLIHDPFAMFGILSKIIRR